MPPPEETEELAGAVKNAPGPTASAGSTSSSAKEWIGLVFSASALAISLSSFYVSNLQVKDEALARVNNFQLVAGAPDDNVNRFRKGYLAVSVAFINSGNRDAIVENAYFRLSSRPDFSADSFGGPVVADEGTFPFVLEPKKIRLLDLKIPISSMLRNLDKGAPAPPRSGDENSGVRSKQAEDGEDKGRRLFYGGFVYTAVDSYGLLHLSSSGLVTEIEASRRGWEKFRPVESERRGAFRATQLLSDADALGK